MRKQNFTSAPRFPLPAFRLSPLASRLSPYAINDLTTNHPFAGRSASRRMYHGYHAEP